MITAATLPTQDQAIADQASQALADYAQGNIAGVQKIAQSSLQVIETKREDERYIPETIYLTAIHPDAAETTTRLMVLMENATHGEESLVNLVTNSTGFMDVIKAVRSCDKFKQRSWQFVESWLPEDAPF